jgi:hypothetical protein
MATYLYVKLELSDNGCWGLIELVYTVVLWVSLAVTFIISTVSTLRKRQSDKLKAEPYTLAITLVTLVTLIVGGFWGDNLKGAKWIDARSQNYSAQPSAQDLTLRRNGTFTIYLREDDFTCYFSGNYKIKGDTLSFENAVIEKTNSKMTAQYLFKDKTLLPIANGIEHEEKFSKFDVISIK